MRDPAGLNSDWKTACGCELACRTELEVACRTGLKIEVDEENKVTSNEHRRQYSIYRVVLFWLLRCSLAG